ncbi:VOC family protein [Streptomyces geranii]|uniref:VOC family protein n=1 Tax=Streptomyces geranii TaxID=2058923 RepID=UPI000D027386|nr:VOC family protein [Streptomyces geranii]
MKFDKPVTGGPCWVELGTTDLEATQRFYADLFGWRPETDTREEMGGYTIAHLGDAPVAAFVPLGEEKGPVSWYVTFAVADVDATLAKLRAAGGSVAMESGDVPGMGRFASAADPDGAAFQLWQDKGFAGAGLLNAPGTLGWVELAARDTEQAQAFYTGVLGWSVTSTPQYTHFGVEGAEFGGMLAMSDMYPPGTPSHWLPYFAVEDVDTSADTATRAGATIAMEPTSIPNGPRIAVLRDPGGAAFGIHREATEG